MNTYRVITPTNQMCYDSFVKADTKAEALRKEQDRIKSLHIFIIIYDTIVEQIA